MAYASTDDVASLNKSRSFGVGNNPTIEDVQTYINMAAAEIDAILVNKGYTVPVDPAYTSAWNLLNAINAKGAVALMERASPTSVNLDRWELEWEQSKTMLVDSQQVMDAPKDVQRAEPRGPGVTVAAGVDDRPYDPVSPYGGRTHRHHRSPMFTRSMEF